MKAEDEINEKIGGTFVENHVPGLHYVYKSQGFKELEAYGKIIMEDFTRKKFKEAESTFNRGLYI